MASEVDNDRPLVAAINTFSDSVRQSGPISCIWFHSNTPQHYQMSNTQIYLCDQSSFSKLRLSFIKVSVLAEGVAWPHITVSGSHLSVKCIMLGHEMVTGSNSMELPPPFIW